MSATNNDSPQGHESLLHAPPPTLGEMLRHAVVSGFIGGVGLSVAVVVIVLAGAALQASTPNFANLAALAGWALAVGVVFSFLVGLLRSSRTLRDSTFTLTGFVATFFGLAMLVVFFWGLLSDVAGWFYYTPVLVEMRNNETLNNRKDLEKVASLRSVKKKAIDDEVAAALKDATTPAERREAIKDYFGSPQTVIDLEAKEAGELKNAKSADDKAKIQARYDEEIRKAGPTRVQELAKEEQAEVAKAKTPAERSKIREKYNTLVLEAGGVYGDNLRAFDATIADRKTLADMPLRDSSHLAVLGHFLFASPSNDAEAVGIKPALFGSLWIAVITMLFAVPFGVGAALYLEEYKHSGRLGYIIQVNINNLAGVPSIVYGILGAFVFVELIFKPLHRWDESISVRNLIGGGMTLGLLTLPVIIVSTQEAIRAVPSSIRQGAYALGATHWQVVRYQVLPLARPGIMTGTILAVSRAIGEAAPLVLFGATTFIAYTPTPVTDFTVLPIQIFNWAERPTNPIFDSVVTASADHTLRFWETPTGKQYRRMAGHKAPATALTFAADGKRLASGGADKMIHVWNTGNWWKLHIFQGHAAEITAVAINRGSSLLASASLDGTAILWNMDKGNKVATLQGHDGAITSVLFTKDGSGAFTAGADKVIRYWDARELPFQLTASSSVGLGAAFAQGPLFAAGQLTLTRTRELRTFTGHAAKITSLALSPDGKTLASGSADRSIALWDVDSGVRTAELLAHSDSVLSLAFSSAGKLLASGGADHAVLIWDLAEKKVQTTLPGHTEAVTSVAFNGPATRLTSGSKDASLRVWDLSGENGAAGTSEPRVIATGAPVLAMVYRPGGRMIEAWHMNMALASLVLLVVLLILNAVAIYLRNRAQKRVRW